MKKFEVDVKMIVEADDDTEAYHMVSAAVENLVCGDIINATVDAVTDLSMVSSEEEYPEIAAELNKD